jgi:choline dehydrogenase-like flavoprotein
MPRLHIDWRYSELDVRTVASAFRLLQRDFAQSALGELTLDPDEADVETVIRRDGAYGGHHIGTARMAHEPAQGVVDEDCRVFGIHNLYVAGSAVFPTSGQANPTLTIVALAIRLAHHIEAEASRPAVILRRSPAVASAHSNAHVPQPVLLAEAVSEHSV